MPSAPAPRILMPELATNKLIVRGAESMTNPLV
jgi:hypothetical protein